ncbi:DUF1569 domain-containing protein [Mucilaginibacter sp. HMF5004]|uniref:DUF1569 domain-containing protein n=1 Tax=Mucilaginibacter rivuli TaxID=2857527 RepID=UPI001C5D8BBD|nr:DUF1569 domain-containing protein [Mucilaginibacter rivuli]MBW4889721.1 DUF1569 domain-containing protein [Mucilaginibacter rivuli]
MKSLLNPVYSKEMIERINRLTPSSAALWGKMRVDQMLAHLNAFFNAALGEVKQERVLSGYLFGWIAKKKILSDQPFGKGLPTAKAFLAKGEYDFEAEKEHLIALIEHYTATKGKDVNKYPHTFFGHLTTMEWDKLITKHLEHHLSQFEV